MRRSWILLGAFIGVGAVVGACSAREDVGVEAAIKNITRIKVAGGLQGGGTGPTVTVGIAPGGITNDRLQDGTLQIAKFSASAKAALKPTPQVHSAQQSSVTVGSGDLTLTDLSTPFDVTVASVVRIDVQVTMDRPINAGAGTDTVTLLLDGASIGACWSARPQTSGPLPRTVHRTVQVEAGHHTLEVHAACFGEANCQIVGASGSGDPLSFMDVEVE